MAWRLTPQPALQGVRAVAVLAVFGFHVGEVHGGWLGVEAFFVLSGFLITALLLGEASGNGVQLGRFYLRRVARLAPAVVVMLIAVLAFCVATGVAVRDSGITAAGALLYSANWLVVAGVEPHGLGHLWSLSIEEQFYLLWPLLLIWTARTRGSRAVMFVSGTGFVLSAIARVLLVETGASFDRIYYGSDTRAAGILAGCFAGALLFQSDGQWSAKIPAWLGWLGAVVLGAAMLLVGEHARGMWSIGVTLFDLTAAFVALSLVDTRHSLSRVLSLRPLVYIGALSYSLYLWHMPTIWAASRVAHGPTRLAIQIVLPFILAAVSFHLIEEPIRRRARGVPRSPGGSSGSPSTAAPLGRFRQRPNTTTLP